ncbi:MAG: hypothetical protein IKB04_06560 [Clostridia bacterium]|nr:hypothetical protein [Clostridia bacterium]
MDDELSRKLDQLLNSPEGMDKIRSTMAALGLSANESAPPAEPPPEAPAAPLNSEMLSGLLGLAPMLGKLESDDQHTALLKALRPYLHNGREKRLDESIKLLQLMKLLPLLQGGLLK